MSESLSFLQVAERVARACETAGVRYLVTGSVAGILQGVVRATQDIDLVVELTAWRLPKLIAALGPEFEVDAEALNEAIRRDGSWNLFHLPTMTKVDLFMLRDDPFAVGAFERRVTVPLPDGASLTVISAGDLVVQKLRWYRDGGEASEQQWRDVVGLLNANPTLPLEQLERSAAQLGLSDLLARARAQVPVSR